MSRDCPNDTNGDGDCGRILCPFCGGGPRLSRRYGNPVVRKVEEARAKKKAAEAAPNDGTVV